MPGIQDGVPSRVASPAPLPPNAHSSAVAALGGGMFANSMHTFVHGCSWGSFGNLAAVGGFGSSGNLAALGAAHAASTPAGAGGGSGSGSSTPTQQQQQQQQVPLTQPQQRPKRESMMRSVFSEPTLNTSA